jgi:RNA polymerase sigma-70 factor (ECF subfamily)
VTEVSAVRAESAWDDLHKPLLDFIFRRVRRHEDAEDVLQEVMLRIHRHRSELVSDEAVMGWIYRIARNAIIDHYRRASTRHETSVGDAMDETESVLVLLDKDDSSSADLREELSRCLAPLARRLPEPYRDALIMTEFEGVSQVEAARLLGLSVSGMKARVQRGREKLKTMLLDCCEVELDRRGSITDYSARSGGCSCS